MKRVSLFKKRVDRIFTNLKDERQDKDTPPIIPIFDKNKFVAYLRVASKSSLENLDEIKKMANWREKHSWWFFVQFKVTEMGTKRWFENQVLKTNDRFLFMIDTPSGETIGHVGLFRFDYENKSCEIDNIVRGNYVLPGIMTHAVNALNQWSFQVLKVKTLYLQVYKDNERAVKLYRRVGFEEVSRAPYRKIIENDIVKWEEIDDPKKAERFVLKMILKSK